MDARKYDEPSSPPPSYESIVNDNRWDYRSNQHYHEERTPDLDQFVRRYESEHLSQYILNHIHINLFSQSKFRWKITRT